MSREHLRIREQPKLQKGTMVLAFSGWMDGGSVSTATVEWLVHALEADRVADIAPEAFYIYNFPGSMELSALFRPHTTIEDGSITAYRPPRSAFYYAEGHTLLFFNGKEPHFNWERFADSLFAFAARSGVSTMFFIGSVAGTVPHTRASRLMSTVSDISLKPMLSPYVSSFTNYDGPASFVTYLMTRASLQGMRMASLVAEIPAYIQGTNPKCILATIKKLVALLGLQADLTELHSVADDWEQRVNQTLEDHEELSEHIGKLESDYDNEVFDTQMDDLKTWLEQRGIRVD